MLKGIDVSHNNDVYSFSKVKTAGYEFVYIKASEGNAFHDPQCRNYAVHAKEAGLPIGFYHFARPDNGHTPEEEAQNFVNAISGLKYDLLPVLDLEVNVTMSEKHLYEWARAFVNFVKGKTGHNVMVYTYLYYLNEYPALKALHDLPLWIALYAPETPALSGWDWVMWQIGDSFSIPGVHGTVDVNVLKDLSAILVDKPQPHPAPDPKPAPAPVHHKPEFKRVLKLTRPPMQGDDVKLLQKRLNVQPVDGIFGKITEESVREWQLLHDEHGHVVKPGKGLPVTGIVDKKTWDALFS